MSEPNPNPVKQYRATSTGHSMMQVNGTPGETVRGEIYLLTEQAYIANIEWFDPLDPNDTPTAA